MEENDLGWLIWVAIALIAAINGIISKKRKTTEQQPSQTVVDNVDTVLSRMFDAESEARANHEKEGSATQSFEAPPAEKRRSSSDVRRATAATVKSEGGRSTVDECTFEADKDDNEQFDFNLRDAVIYSEILHPKFDE